MRDADVIPESFLRAFRRARPASARWNLTKTLLQTSIFWLLFLLVFPCSLYALERRLGWPLIDPAEDAGRVVTWVLFGAASTLGVASGWTMAVRGEGTPLPTDAPRRLVVHGPYRFVRNPMAIAGLSQGACVAALLGSPLSLALVALGFLVWNFVVRPIEEADLEREFGEAFHRYRTAVRCWIPRLTAYRE